MILSLIQVLPAPAGAASEAFTGSSAVSGVYGVATPITDLQVSGTGNDTINVRLYVTSGTLAMGTTTGLTFTGSSSGATLQFSGTRTNVNTALATLTYTRSTPGTDTLEASLVGAGEIYYPANGHLYEVVTSTQTWTNAQTAAAALTKYGATGYLATITSAEENQFVSDRLSDAGWMGASDATTENDWQWVTGPEAGTSFWSGLANGSAVSGRYENWADGEPNNAGNEDCAQFLAGGSGEWNDLPCTVTTLPRYVVEYGTSGTLPAVQSKNVAITTGTSTHSISSCTQLQNMSDIAYTEYDTFELTQDIDCAGIVNFVPIGSAGAAAWSTFRGIFDGNGHKIQNLTISRADSGVGLFKAASGATFQDLTLESGSVTNTSGLPYTGALVGGPALNCTFTNITSHLDVTGNDDYVGGIAGGLTQNPSDTTITNVRSDGTVTGGGTGTGGLFGGIEMYNGGELTIVRSAFTGEVTGDASAGGLVGQLYITENGNSGLTIRDSYANAAVEGGLYVGGLIGAADPTINNSNTAGIAYITLDRTYSTGSATANTDYASGLVGYVAGLASGETFTVTDSFAATMPGGPGSHKYALFYVHNTPSGGTQTTEDLYVDDLRAGVASWANVAVTDVYNVNTTGTPDADYFYRTTTQEPLDEWDFVGGDVWYAHPDTFPTHEPGNDDDEDGVSRTTEDAGPNSGDANNDGTPDSQQGNVASFVSSLSSKSVAIELPSACQLTSAAMRSEAQLGTDAGYDYPQGLVRFAASCGTPGYTAGVELYFYDVTASGLVLRKANPARNAYYAMPNAVLTQLTIGGTTVTRANYEVTDGSQLDEDAAANAIIIDPAGLALGAVAVPNTGLGGSRR